MPNRFRINTLTSCCLQRSRVPLTLPSDREVIEARHPAPIRAGGRSTPRICEVVVIPNTIELKSLWVSSPLEDEVRAHPHLTRASEYQPMEFLQDGSLDQAAMFPASVRGRRGRIA